MNHNACILQSISNEINSLNKKSCHVKSITILTRDLQIERNFRFGMIKINSLCCCQDSPNTMFYIRWRIYFEVFLDFELLRGFQCKFHLFHFVAQLCSYNPLGKRSAHWEVLFASSNNIY